MSLELYYPTLEGIIVGETNISSLDEGLLYRGYAIEDLARSSSFVEVAYLLLYAELPTEEQLADFESILMEESELPEAVARSIQEIPLHVPLVEVLRTAFSLLGHYDGQLDGNDDSGSREKAIRLLARIPLIIAARLHGQFATHEFEFDHERSLAANVYQLVLGKPPLPFQERIMDLVLILHAEHEFNAATYAARVVASTGADLYAAIVAAMGAYQGVNVGGVSERAAEFLTSLDDVEQAREISIKRLQKEGGLPGFGHSVYKHGDPREKILRPYCDRLAAKTKRDEQETIAAIVEQVAWEHQQKQPTLDWITARVFHYLDIPRELFIPISLIGRVVGWCAHIAEQQEEERLIRPRARYRGATGLKYAPMAVR